MSPRNLNRAQHKLLIANGGVRGKVYTTQNWLICKTGKPIWKEQCEEFPSVSNATLAKMDTRFRTTLY